MKEPTKITISSYDITSSWEINHSDVTIDDLIHGVVSCLLGISFLHEQITDSMKEYVEKC